MGGFIVCSFAKFCHTFVISHLNSLVTVNNQCGAFEGECITKILRFDIQSSSSLQRRIAAVLCCLLLRRNYSCT